MRWHLISSVFVTALPLAISSPSSKRGLVYVPSTENPTDDSIWTSSSSDLTWYYNYTPDPSPALNATKKLEFVPMLWGAPSDTSDTTFLTKVRSQIEGGTNITYALGFNEPDGQGNGGSNVPADTAAQVWQRNMNPLKEQGVKLGAPAMTGGPSGFTWLQAFFTACAGNCTVDFIPIHWYGNFEGLASHIGQVQGTYPNISTVWVTEYALAEASLADSISFYNSSADYFDRVVNITHYSYFGAFRSSVSNVGPNAAMLTEKGKLTDIGSFYLGGSATGNKPKGAAGRISVFAGWSLMIGAAAIFSFL
ncbi:MAG: hypothetical protein M1812_000213 [Candelaria pacifica]|nr:MAG: hypothetical protein M1812_000213 [Candelaria pacifica]